MNKGILRQHAREAAFLWPPRDAAARAPDHDLSDLEQLDERIEAHLDGLRIGGDAGWSACEAALASPGPGEVFTAVVIAAGDNNSARLDQVLEVAAETATLARAVIAALAWVPLDRASALIDNLLAPDRPAAHRTLGIAAHAARRADPGAALTNALYDRGAPSVEARAVRAVGELGRIDLLSFLRERLAANDEALRFAAAWSAALLGEAAAIPALWAFAEAGGRFAEPACAAALRRMDGKSAIRASRSLALSPDHARTAVIGAAALGEPGAIPFLLEQMKSPATARIAGDAFTAITGARIERALAGRPPPGHVADPARDDDPLVNPDAPLRWPDAKAASELWARESSRFALGTRYLLGAPITPEHLDRVLIEGDQRRRAGAAFELAVRAPGSPLFEVRAPAMRQRIELTGRSAR